MATFAGSTATDTGTVAYGLGTQSFEREAIDVSVIEVPLDILTDIGTNPADGPPLNFVNGNVFTGVFMDQGQPDWFENFHVIPRLFEFGNILSTQTAPVLVFSGFRKEFRTWSAFVNNAGAGTTLLNIPALPATMNPLEGYSMTLEVTTNGNPSVDDDLAFIFDFGGTTITVPISLNRIVLFPVLPEIPYRERLQFNTDMLFHEDGGEQRISVRKNPRQIFEWNIRIDDGTFDRSRMDALMFDWQGRTWGVPMWHEATALTADAAIGALTISVVSTADADYRVGGLVMIYQDSQVFDVQTIASVTSTTITLTNATLAAYSSGTLVSPLRTGNMRQRTSSSRFISGDQSLDVEFRILDNDANLADTAAFGTHNGKVLLDTCNIIRGGGLSEDLQRKLIVLDNQTGITYQDSPWTASRRGYPLTLRSNSKTELWNLRKLMHAFRGRQVSFYVPTFLKDLLPDADLVSASQDLNIVNVGYTQFVNAKQPKNKIWVKFTDGTTIIRTITSSVVTTATRETLTLDAVWGVDKTVAEIEKISYLEEIRFDRDEINFDYNLGERQVHISAPVISVLD